MPGARSTGVINGTDLGVYLGGSPALIAAATSCTINLNRDMRDTSNKDSAGWKKVLPAQKSWTVSVEGLFIPAGTNNYYTLYTALIAGTALTVTWKVGTNTTGDIAYSGTAYLTSLSKSAPNEGNVTFSANFQGDGAITPTDPIAG
jgi:TP901-1 family phage major tail protein